MILTTSSTKWPEDPAVIAAWINNLVLKKDEHSIIIWLVVWNILYFPIYWELSSQLTNIFQRGSNHQLDNHITSFEKIVQYGVVANMLVWCCIFTHMFSCPTFRSLGGSNRRDRLLQEKMKQRRTWLSQVKDGLDEGNSSQNEIKFGLEPSFVWTQFWFWILNVCWSYHYQ